ncbi:hypothetical protein RR46_02853 [Papilio xuthus]|uniref:MD-2-related lipid-recognition domain-containing protein n=1 Tax=Papilio xuthus TaxID=66420 RepID=A0A194QHK4_PAPXU|nr:hypothetical protein RR46_02853 [Papilio xuthus]
MCDFLDQDPYIGKVAATAGVACPIQARRYTLANISINLVEFPSVFPFEKGRINFCFNSTATGESVGEGALYLSFKNEPRNKHG